MNLTLSIPDARVRRKTQHNASHGSRPCRIDQHHDFPLIDCLAQSLRTGDAVGDRRAARRLLEEAFRAIDATSSKPKETV